MVKYKINFFKIALLSKDKTENLKNSFFIQLINLQVSTGNTYNKKFILSLSQAIAVR